MERWAYRLDVPRDDLIPALIHGGEVIHGREEDVDLDDVLKAAASFFQDGRDVIQGLLLSQPLVLGATSRSSPGGSLPSCP